MSRRGNLRFSNLKVIAAERSVAHQPFLTVKLGALDDNADLEPEMHVYVSSAPAWHEINDGLPKFAQMPPTG